MGEVLVIILLLGLSLSIVVGLPAAGLWWLAKWHKRQNHQRAATAVQGLLAGLALFWIVLIYSFYFPFDSEFKNEFKQLTGLPFPESGEVVKGDMSGLDLGGDYYVEAQIRVSPHDYHQILRQITADASFLCNTDTVASRHPISSSQRSNSSCKFFTKHKPEQSLRQTIRFFPDKLTIAFSKIDE